MTECQNYSLINDLDNDWWQYIAIQRYDYMVFRFNKPAGYDGGTCRWRVGGTENVVKLYRWNWNLGLPPGRFVLIDENAGGDPPGVEYVDIPDSWFSPEDLLYLMAVVMDAPREDRIKCDVMDIDY